jgi:hypothetical protein
MRTTHTYALLPVSQATYDEIRGKLKEAGYEHCFHGAATDMHGIGLVRATTPDPRDAEAATNQQTTWPDPTPEMLDTPEFEAVMLGVTVTVGSWCI